MEKKILVQSDLYELRIALLEDNQLAEFIYEKRSTKSLIGNIYKARVSKILPGINSAFVEIGHSRSAFLFGGDVLEPGMQKGDPIAREYSPKNEHQPIARILQEGQEIVVQVTKDPLGTKGPRVSMVVTLPGRYTVLLPNYDHVGLSRKIASDRERQRLSEIAQKIEREDVGIVLRTAAESMTFEELSKDFYYLENLWRVISKRVPHVPLPSLLHEEVSVVEKVVRDLCSESVKEIIVDDKETYSNLHAFLKMHMPALSKCLLQHEGSSSLLETYNIEAQLQKSLDRKVALPSGGHLVFEQTEALTSIDVNTGSFIGSGSPQNTILKTNLEAIPTLVRELRMRNIGGIIVIDFIDMDSEGDRRLIYERLNQELEKDRGKTYVLPVSELGLVQMTRKRTSETLERKLFQECTACAGRGLVPSYAAQAYVLSAELKGAGEKSLRLALEPDFQAWLLNNQQQRLSKLEAKYSLEIDESLAKQKPFEIKRD